MEDILVFLLIAAVIGFKMYFQSLWSEDTLYEVEKDLVEHSATVGKTTLMHTCSRLKGTMDKDGKGCSGKLNGINYSLKIDFAYGFLLSVEQKLPISGSLSIKRETVVSTLKKDLGINDLLLGDKIFDDKMHVETTEPSWLAAVLNNENRILVVDLSEKTEKFSITRSFVKINLTQYGTSADRLTDRVKKAIKLSQALSVKDTVKKMLIHNLYYDQEEGVRLNNLKMLAARFPRSRELTRIYHDAMEDPCVEIQIEAAIQLKEKGMARLLAILKNKETFDAERIISVFRDNRYRKSIPVLKEIYDERNDADMRISILKAFRTIGDDKLGSFLAGKLNEPDNAVLVQILRTLGTCGSVNEIERIHGLAKTARQSKVREEARNAMAIIQNRLGGDKGWLSVVEHAEADGALSMADVDAEGRLSIAGEEKSK